MSKFVKKKQKVTKNPFRFTYIWSWLFLSLCLLGQIYKVKKKISGKISVWSFLFQAWYTEHHFITPLAFCLIGPILEEFIFRYLVFKTFGKKSWLPYFVSFFGFIFAHRRMWNSSFNTTGFFILAFWVTCFIFIYWLSDWNLFFPIALHILVNTIPFITGLIQQNNTNLSI